MTLEFVRTLRTLSSERFLLRRDGIDFAALEIHYREGHADCTLIIFEESEVSESQVPDLLKQIDDVLLPDVSLSAKNLVFTVVVGRVLGAFAAEAENASNPESVRPSAPGRE